MERTKLTLPIKFQKSSIGDRSIGYNFGMDQFGKTAMIEALCTIYILVGCFRIALSQIFEPNGEIYCGKVPEYCAIITLHILPLKGA
jgi:hypothetical protein